jgi:hypothetical protein
MIGPRGLSVLIFAGLVALALAVCLTGGQNQRLVLRG